MSGEISKRSDPGQIPAQSFFACLVMKSLLRLFGAKFRDFFGVRQESENRLQQARVKIWYREYCDQRKLNSD
jgi:hypothetical protein